MTNQLERQVLRKVAAGAVVLKSYLAKIASSKMKTQVISKSYPRGSAKWEV